MALVRSLLGAEAAIEVCVHIDGSNDGTDQALAEIASRDARLSITRGPNGGRGVAMFSAIASATGEYCTIFDDDDDFFVDRLPEVFGHLSRFRADDDIAGLVFSMILEGKASTAEFPAERTNFIKMRADEHVAGDKKEIVRTALLKRLAVPPMGQFRRVPTSLLWARVAMEYDVICVPDNIGRKRYLPEGMTKKNGYLKLKNPYPILLLNGVYVMAFWRRRYRSVKFLAKALVSCLIFGFLSVPFLLKICYRKSTGSITAAS